MRVHRPPIPLLALLMLALCLPARAVLLPWSALRGAEVRFVTGATAGPNDDARVRAYLEAHGLRVRTVGAHAPVGDLTGVRLVIISSTASPEALGDKYAGAPVPVFTWNAFDYPHLGLTGPRLHRDFGVVDPVQHFAESFSVLYGYGANTTSAISRAVGLKPQLFGTLYLEPATVGWGHPGPGGRVLVDFNGTQDQAGVFTYERAATLADGRPAPARRVGFYLSNDNFHLLTAVHGPAARQRALREWYLGLKLFGACLRWAMSPPPALPAYDPRALDARIRRIAAGKKILYVERLHAGEGRRADAAIVARLRRLGFRVVIADQMDPQRRARGMNLVLISSTCSKYKLANKYVDVPVPLISMEGLLSDTLHFAGRDRYVDYGEHGEEKESDDPPTDYLDIVGAWNPMAAGLPPGPVKFMQTPGVLKWARPTPDAIVIATLPGAPQQRAIFGYPKGATMADGFVAPARRALLPMDNPTFDDITPQGKALFDAVVLWALGGP